MSRNLKKIFNIYFLELCPLLDFVWQQFCNCEEEKKQKIADLTLAECNLLEVHCAHFYFFLLNIKMWV